jgi:carbamoyl-phosphate synthase large subunit
VKPTAARDMGLRPREWPACVLVPGAGEAAGVGAIKALRMAGYRGQIVATDADPLSVGLELADVGAVVPRRGDDAARALEVVRRHGVAVVLPTSTADVRVYARHAGALREAGAVFVGCNVDVVETCLDAWRFAERMRGRVPMPRTALGVLPDDVGFPCVVRPRCGEGTAVVCADAEALARRLAAGEAVVVQEHLPGAAYAVDVLADLDGEPLVAVPRLRLAVHEGVSLRGQVVQDAEIERLCLRLAAMLGVTGPVCVQLRRDRAGRPRVVRVQPRLGSSTFFTALAGVNVAALCLDLAARRPLPALGYAEIAVARYLEEVVLVGQDRRRRRAGGGRPRAPRRADRELGWT